MKIALTQRVLYHNGRAYDGIEHGWYRYLCHHDLVFVPNNPSQDFQKIADSVDALVITGGDDSAIRRVTELRLASIMMKMYKPILGVCHGAFLLTDVLGGSVSECHGHMDTHHNVHYTGLTHQVNSYHTQTITNLHKSGTVLATDDDGNCEAWIDGRIAGIVWHPERMASPWIPVEISNLSIMSSN